MAGWFDRIKSAVSNTVNAVVNTVVDTVNIVKTMAGGSNMGADKPISSNPEERKAEMAKLRAANERMAGYVKVADGIEVVAKPVQNVVKAVANTAVKAAIEVKDAAVDGYTVATGNGTATEVREAFERTEARLNTAEAILKPVVELEKKAAKAVGEAAQDAGTMIQYGAATYTGNEKEVARLEQAAIEATNRMEARIAPVKDAVVSAAKDTKTLVEFSVANAMGDEEKASRLAAETIAAADRTSTRIVKTAQALPAGDTIASGVAQVTDATGLTKGNYQTLEEFGGNKTVNAVQNIVKETRENGKLTVSLEDGLQVGLEVFAVVAPGGKGAAVAKTEGKAAGMLVKETVIAAEETTKIVAKQATKEVAKETTVAMAKEATVDVAESMAKEGVLKTAEKVIVKTATAQAKKPAMDKVKKEGLGVTNEVLVATTGKDIKGITADIKEGVKAPIEEIKTYVASLKGKDKQMDARAPMPEPAISTQAEMVAQNQPAPKPTMDAQRPESRLQDAGQSMSGQSLAANIVNEGTKVLVALNKDNMSESMNKLSGLSKDVLAEIMKAGQQLKDNLAVASNDVSRSSAPSSVASNIKMNSERTV